MRLVWQSAPGWTVANFGLILIQGLLPLVSLYLMKLIVDAVTAGLLAPEKTASLRKVILLILVAAAVALFAACCRSLTEIVKEAQTQMVTDHVADVIHGKSVAVDLESYEDPKYYDTLHRAQQEATYRPTQHNGQPDAIGPKRHLVFGPGRFAVLISLVGCPMLFVAAVPGVLVRLKSPSRCTIGRGSTPRLKGGPIIIVMLTGGRHAQEIRLFGLGSLFMDWFRELRKLRFKS